MSPAKALTKKDNFDKLYWYLQLINLQLTTMIAIIQTGGKQYLVKKGDKIQVEKLSGEAGSTVNFDQVLLTSNGTDVNLGKPFVSGAKVEGKVLKQGRGEKVRVFKYKAKSKYRRTIGHRQSFTEVEITKI